MQTSRTSRLVFYIVGLISTAVAIGIHIYLTREHMVLRYAHEAGASMCNINELFNCAAASASRFSELFGVPMALWGTITNLVLFALAAAAPLADDQSKGTARANVLLIAGFVAVTSVVMGVISLTQLSQYCPFCFATYFCSFVAFVGFWKGLPLPNPGLSPKLRPNFLVLASAGVAILIIGFVTNQSVKRAYVGDNSQFEQTVKDYVREWNDTSSATLEVVAPLVKGNQDPNAAMSIVEFADFRCPHCKDASPVLDAFVRSHPDVRLTFQTWPLDGQCNTAIEHSSGASCRLARAFICATQKGKGWEAHDWLFANQEQMQSMETIETQLQKMAGELTLPWNELKTCVDSDETRKLVEQQAALGAHLNVKGTPTVFVNGKQLPGGQTLPVLQAVYTTLKK